MLIAIHDITISTKKLLTQMLRDRLHVIVMESPNMEHFDKSMSY